MYIYPFLTQIKKVAKLMKNLVLNFQVTMYLFIKYKNKMTPNNNKLDISIISIHLLEFRIRLANEHNMNQSVAKWLPNCILKQTLLRVAATLLEGGRTAHSMFKLPLNLNSVEEPFCNIVDNPGTCELLKETKVPVILAGDFRQTLPIISHGTPADQVDACLKNSYLWNNIKIITLKTNMRVFLTVIKMNVQYLTNRLNNNLNLENFVLNFINEFMNIISSFNV
ncbi:hypothetical protein AGLY_017193 [Aphis glycines]|uniref:ATP-dependent DNA helicase n=1 Tax=Aphis glycines TaxID=307491 RepID=A0A6G0SVK6_APHGL|nr:hypothetical protein AGLY_017193 [Aphis glycines]